MHNISLKEKLLKEKSQTNEKQILQREMELALKERLLLQKTDRYINIYYFILSFYNNSISNYIFFLYRLHKEQNNKKKEQDVRKTQEQKGVQTELQVESFNHFLKNIEVQTDFINNMQQEHKIEILTKEKEELNALIQDQQLKIEQITQRALQLSRQIEGIRSLRSTNIEIPTQTVNINTIISESSSTEDILQDAKLRLKRLEEESLKADQYYYNFINNSP